jgi:hypothetical protein
MIMIEHLYMLFQSVIAQLLYFKGPTPIVLFLVPSSCHGVLKTERPGDKPGAEDYEYI